MGICLTGQKKDTSEINVINSKLNNPNQSGGTKLKRIKTKFPKHVKNAGDEGDDDDENEEKDKNKKKDDK